MGQGLYKIARNLVDLQPTAIVELFLLYFDTVDKENAFIAFHGGSIFSKGITWQGIEYLPLPVETEGFEITANGELPRPKIKILVHWLSRSPPISCAVSIRKASIKNLPSE